MKKMITLFLLMFTLSSASAQIIASEITQLLNNIQLLMQNLSMTQDTIRQIEALRSAALEIQSTVTSFANQIDSLTEYQLNPDYYANSFNKIAKNFEKGDISSVFNAINDFYDRNSELNRQFQENFVNTRKIAEKYTNLANQLLSKAQGGSQLGTAQVQAQLQAETLKQNIRAQEEQAAFLKRQDDREFLRSQKEKKQQESIEELLNGKDYTIDENEARSFKWSHYD